MFVVLLLLAAAAVPVKMIAIVSVRNISKNVCLFIIFFLPPFQFLIKIIFLLLRGIGHFFGVKP
jgi:hypothetical protein